MRSLLPDRWLQPRSRHSSDAKPSSRTARPDARGHDGGLRKLDQQVGRAGARRYAAWPYKIVVISDHGQTQGATFKQRNGYGLDELAERSLGGANVTAFAGGDEQRAMVEHAMNEATGRKRGRHWG